MNIRNYVGRGLANLALAGSLFLGGCGYIPTSTPVELENRIEQEEATQNHTPDKYAVLVSVDNLLAGLGRPRQMYTAKTRSAYQVLVQNGFNKENIYILTDIGVPQPDYPVDGVASRNGLSMILEHLSKKVDEEDVFLLYINGHGSRKPIESNNGTENVTVSNYHLRGGDINELQLRECLSQIKAKRKKYVFDFCFDGGFSERLGRGNDIAISSSSPNKANMSYWQENFSRHFFDAFKEGSNADYDGDGRVSFSEAFEYTRNTGLISKRVNASQINSRINADRVFLN